MAKGGGGACVLLHEFLLEECCFKECNLCKASHTMEFQEDNFHAASFENLT